MFLVHWVLIITILISDQRYELNPSYYESQERCEKLKKTFLEMEVFKTYKAEAACHQVSERFK